MEQILKAIFIIFCVNLIAILGQNPGDGAQYELEIVKLELHSGEEYLKFKGIRAKRYNRTVFGIFGDVEITVAFDEKWEVEVNVYRSKLGNNQWDLTPMKVTRRSACDFVDSIYKPKIQPDVKDISNFPIFGDDDNCPFPKVIFVNFRGFSGCSYREKKNLLELPL